MTTLERNNLDVQIKLMKDIIDNDHNIFYHVTTRGKELIEILTNVKYNDDDKTCTYSQEDFNKMANIAYILKEESEFHKLGILAETAVPMNKMNKEILALLQKG